MTNKTTFLNGFPPHLYGRSPRAKQAALRAQQARIRDCSPGELSAQLAACLPAEEVSRHAGVQRRRIFSREVTFWGFLAQVFHKKDGACAYAVSCIQAWCADHHLPVPSSHTTSYCEARGRLPVKMLNNLLAYQVQSLDRQLIEGDRWHGHVVKAVDGTSAQLSDTEANQASFPQPAMQQPGCGFPVMKISALLNLCHGGIEHFVTADRFHHDSRMLDALLPYVNEDEVLLGDRAYASYELFALVARMRSWLVARHHQCRKIDWRKGRKIGADSRLVTWKRPAQQPKGSTLSRDEWQALPEEMEIRLVRARGRGRDGRRKTFYFATNLLDAQSYPSEDIASLYLERWEIELRFRDIKTTMGMERLRTKSPEMVAKELRMFLIAYNAVRQLMMQACRRYGGVLQRTSFQGCLDVLAAFRGQFRQLLHRPRKLADSLAQLLLQIARRVVPDRPGRSEPRAVKRRPKPHHYLTSHRSVFREIPHRNHYRKNHDNPS